MANYSERPRRFPPPWDIEDNGACFIVRDNNGQALSYVYYENQPAQLLTWLCGCKAIPSDLDWFRED
jgi:hypothetical protein